MNLVNMKLNRRSRVESLKVPLAPPSGCSVHCRAETYRPSTKNKSAKILIVCYGLVFSFLNPTQLSSIIWVQFQFQFLVGKLAKISENDILKTKQLPDESGTKNWHPHDANVFFG